MVQSLATQHLLTQERQCLVMAEAQALKTQTVKDSKWLTKTKPGSILLPQTQCSQNHTATMKHRKLKRHPMEKLVK